MDARELLWIGFLGLVYVIIKFRPDWFNQIIIAVAGKAIGKAAMAQQPDSLTLESRSGPVQRPEARGAIDSLQRRGFQSAGSYGIQEMKGMPVHFLTKQDESAIAVVYEHPQAGVWCDLVCRYTDGTTFTITNAKAGGGLEPRPGHTTVRAPGITPVALHMRFMRERPAGTLANVVPAAVPTVFVNAYEEEMAWRKNKGLTTAEVRASAREKIA
jgi:hypothetical protein